MVQGTVMDEQGNLYSNVEVTLQPGNIQKDTDNNGGYIFNDLTPGDYQVLIKPPTASEVPLGNSTAVTLTEGQTQNTSFTLKILPVEATLVLDQNDPLSQVRNEQGSIPVDGDELLFRLQGGSSFPILAPDGHQLTLEEWSTAQGTSTVICDKTASHYDISLTGLIPDGVYTVWNNIYASSQRPGNFGGAQIAGGALGRADGSENGFTASSSGTATISFIVGGGEALGFGGEQPDCVLTDAGGIVLVVLYHIDGQTYGSDPGPPETWVDHLLFFY